MISDRFPSLLGDAAGGVHTILSALNADDEAREQRNKRQKLAEKLQVRLRFAAFKIRRGWQDCTVEEVVRRCQSAVEAEQMPLQVQAPASLSEGAPEHRSGDVFASHMMDNGVLLLPLLSWRGIQTTGAEPESSKLGVGGPEEGQQFSPSSIPMQHSPNFRTMPPPAAGDYAATNIPQLPLDHQEQSAVSLACRIVGPEVQDVNLACLGPVQTWAAGFMHSAADDVSSTINPFYNARELMVTSPVPTPERTSRSPSSYHSPMQVAPPDNVSALHRQSDAATASSHYGDSGDASDGGFLSSLEVPGPYQLNPDYVADPMPAPAPTPAGPSLTTTEATALMVRLSQPHGHSWATTSSLRGNSYSDLPVIPLVCNEQSNSASRVASL